MISGLVINTNTIFKKKSLLTLLISSLCFVACDKANEQPTSTPTPEPEEVYTHFPDGFISLDGLDDATGRYRINVFPSSQPIGDAVGEYTDIVLFLYSCTQPTEHTIPVGEAQPYSMTGANLSCDILYNPGRHFTDAEGYENMAGSGWWNYDEEHNVKSMRAAHLGNQIITFDEEAEEYNFKGVMIDTLSRDTLRYTFTSKNEFMVIPQ